MNLNIFIKLAKQIEFKPKKHQIESKSKSQKTDAILFYHGMGTGKTLSSIYSSKGKTNVVVPAALRKNYENTLKNFDIGNSKKFNVISYNKATRYGIKPKNTLIVDEIQRIGNPTSARSSAILEAAKTHKKRIALTGTPASNHPYELATVMRFLSPKSKEIPLNPTEFNKKFLSEKKIKIPFWKRLIGIEPGTEYDIKNEDLIKKVIKGKVHYHKGGTKNFPKRIDEVEKIEMDNEQTKYYKFVTGKANPMLALKIRMNMPLSKKESSQLNAFMTAARQVSNTAGPYGGKTISPKIQKAVEDIKEMKGKDKNFRSVLYSNYHSGGLEPVEKLLSKSNIKFDKFTGKMNDEQKDRVIKKYNNGEIDTLLLSGAGAEGISLNGTKLMQILEPHWNKNKIEQVIARGIRFKSHDHLPEKERVVRVKKYQSILPKTIVQDLLGKQCDTSSDEYLDELSEKKDKLLIKFLNIFKEEGSK